MTTDLLDFSTDFLTKLYAAGKRMTVDGQEEAVFEEVGEAIACYRRWRGEARRTDTIDHVAEELADTRIAAHVLAVLMCHHWIPLPLWTGRPLRPSLDTFTAVTGQPIYATDAQAAIRLMGEAAGRLMTASLDDDRAGQVYQLGRIANAAGLVAHALDIDLDAAVTAKCEVILSRGFGNQGDITMPVAPLAVADEL